MLYSLLDGSLIYCAEATVSDDGIVFPASRAVALSVDPASGKVALVRMDSTIGKPKSVTVPSSAVVMVRDVTDQDMAGQMRAAMSGIVLARAK